MIAAARRSGAVRVHNPRSASTDLRIYGSTDLRRQGSRRGLSGLTWLIAAAEKQCQVDRSATTDSRIYGLAELRTCRQGLSAAGALAFLVARPRRWREQSPAPTLHTHGHTELRNYGLVWVSEAWRLPRSGTLHACGRGDARRIAPLRIHGFADLRTCGLVQPRPRICNGSRSSPRRDMVLQSGQVRLHDRSVRNIGLVARDLGLVAMCNRASSSASTDSRLYGLAELRHHAE